jgi:molybdate transport system substrate-binding protein
MRRIFAKTCLAVLAMLASLGLAAADEVRIASVGGVKDALDPIIADFTKATGHKVTYVAASPAVLPKRIASEGFDVVVQSVPAMDDLAKAGGLKADSRKAVARGGIGVAVAAKAAAPDISTADAFKKSLLAAKSIGIGDPTTPNGSGVVIQRILAKSGIADQLKGKLQVVGLDPGQKQIAAGELELGLMNSSEVRSYLKFVGQVPAPLQDYTEYEVAVTAKSAAPAAASALAALIESRDATRHWTAARMEPRAK